MSNNTGLYSSGKHLSTAYLHKNTKKLVFGTLPVKARFLPSLTGNIHKNSQLFFFFFPGNDCNPMKNLVYCSYIFFPRSDSMPFLFSPDSKIMQIISRFCDIVILNLLFLVTCLPLFTIGAASAAMYTVVFRMDTDKEEGLFRTYFRAFRDNFLQGTAIWLLLALFGAASCVNMVQFSQLGGVLGYLLFLIAMLVFLVVVLIFSYVFPLLSQFRNSIKESLKNALLLSVAHLPRSILLAVINCFPAALLVLNLYAFAKLSYLWMVLYFAAAAYFNSRVLNKVFKPYWEQAEA